ncbi:MAG: SGNH/GDSL hydrolase family protein [Blautia sp.]|nr:SGNH/GDSL hydrolase family protein [Blautia sp.]
MHGKRIRNLIRIAGIFLLLAALLAGIQRLLMPKYMDDVLEGGMIEEYYAGEKDHDVIFFGDCEVYTNFSPVTLWQEYGINSYIRGSAEQLMWQSYYLMEETFTYEKPKVAVFNVLAMMFNEPQKESYNRMTLDGMRWSAAKVKSIQASMTEEEHFIEYVFPILRYHSRWNQLLEEDFRYFWGKDPVTFNGYYMRVDVLPAENVPEGRPLADYRFGERAYDYLDRMVELCEKNDVELVLVKAPSLYPYWYEEWEEQIVAYAEEHRLKYYNLLEAAEEIGLDYREDTYDAGLHLNLSGAEKLSRYFGGILAEDCGLADRRDEQELALQWQETLEAYQREQQRQQEEIYAGLQ